MKKCCFIFSLALLVMTSLVGCTQASAEKIVQINADGLILADSASDLQQVSDLIVVFIPESQENVLSYFSDGNVSIGYTKTFGAVSQVLSGNISAEDSIFVTEECYTTDSGSVLWTQEGYLPMKIGESYLLFLKAYSDDSAYAGMYFPVDLEYGKYVLSDTTLMSANTSYNVEQLEVGPAADLDTYVEWYENVRTFYPELF